MGENPYNEGINGVENGNVKEIADVLKKVKGFAQNDGDEIEQAGGIGENTFGSEFKVAKTNLPEKTGFWTKVKNALFYEIKVELTPYQQKVENEINDFLHQDITWKSLKEAALSEVPITFRGKRIF